MQVTMRRRGRTSTATMTPAEYFNGGVYRRWPGRTGGKLSIKFDSPAERAEYQRVWEALPIIELQPA